jgi:hypothetical protein
MVQTTSERADQALRNMAAGNLPSGKTDAGTPTKPAILGEVSLLDEYGAVAQVWSVTSARCSIGSGQDCTVRLDGLNLADSHLLVFFGKNRSLIRADQGAFRIAGKPTRETLIDEPTQLQAGSGRFLIVPAEFVSGSRRSRHWVAAGTIAEQASRLKTGPIVNPQYQASVAVPIRSASDADLQLGSTETETRTPEASSKVPVAAFDPSVILEALVPIQRSIDTANEGLQQLSNRVDVSESRIAQFQSSFINPTESSQASQQVLAEAFGKIDERINGFTQQCATFLSNVANSIDSKFENLDGLIDRLGDRVTAIPQPPSELPWTEPTYQEEQLAASPNAAPDIAMTDRARWARSDEKESPSADQIDSYGHFGIVDEGAAAAEETLEEQPLQHAYAEEAPVVQELPAWFTDNETASERIEEPTATSSQPEPVEDGAPWLAAHMNPLYAEDTSAWLQDSEESERTSFAAVTATPLVANEFSAKANQSPNELPIGLAIDSILSEASQPSSEESTSQESFDQFWQPSLEQAESSRIEEETLVPDDELLDDPQPVSGPDEDEFEHDSSPVRSSMNEESEESIEDYMQRLLQRVKGGPSDNAVPLAKTVRSETTVATKTTERSSRTDMARDSSIAQTPVTASTDSQPTSHVTSPAANGGDQAFTPRQSAPERTERLAALRELANDTARSAIQTSTRKKIEIGLWGKVIISAMGLIAGVVLLALNGFHANIAMIGMICCFIVCLLWGYEASIQAKQLFKPNAPPVDPGKQPAASS